VKLKLRSRVAVGATLAEAQIRLATIRQMHVQDILGRCVQCDLGWPCRTWRVASGEDR
jgi:hypothetical protein